MGIGACDHSGAEVEAGPDAQFDHEGLLDGELEATLLNDAPAVGLPWRLTLAARTLWVADLAGDPSLHALEAETGDLLLSVGRRGEGPGEFGAGPFSLVTRPNGDPEAIWAFDPGFQRITRFDAGSMDEAESISIRLQGVPSVQRVVWVEPNRMIGQSQSDEARFSLFRSDGTRERTVPGLLLGSSEIPWDVRNTATNGAIDLCAWPSKGFALVYFNAGRIEFYDSEAQLVRLAATPFPSEVAFEADGSGEISPSYDSRWYVGCSATTEYLFALFSGRVRSGSDRDARASGRFVHVFDWGGGLRSSFRLDRDVSSVAVDPDGAVLYAGALSDGRIYRFSLPSLRGAEARR